MESMHLVVEGCDIKPTYIPISSTTRLEELKLSWYEEPHMIPGTTAFSYQGREIDQLDTPELLGMQDYDSIEVHSVKDNKRVNDTANDPSYGHWSRETTLQPEMLKLGIRFNPSRTRFFDVVSTDQLSLLFKTWCDQTKCRSDTMVFVFRGFQIFGHSTPKFLNMDDEAVIDAYSCSSQILHDTSSRTDIKIKIITDCIFHNCGPIFATIAKDTPLKSAYKTIARMTGRKRGEFSIIHRNKEGRIAYRETAEQLNIQNGDELILQWRHSKTN